VALAPVAALALLVAVLVAGARHGSPSSAGAAVSLARAPSFDLADLRQAGGTVSIGNPARPTVVNFFAAWCGPCRDEMPRLARAASSRTDVDFVGVDVQDVRSEALDLLAASHADYPVGVDPDKAVARAYHLRGMPTTFLIAPGGRVLAAHTGPLTAGALGQLLKRLEPR
jgi:cytochrome c biogenesis protein CcmG/thiol:disulfide interchange protein DsbE